MDAPEVDLRELDDWRGKICLWISISRKFTYMVHIGRYRGGAYLKEQGSSGTRFKNVEAAWLNIEEGLDENNSWLGNDVYVFKALVPETSQWYKITDLILAERELAAIEARTFNGEKINADEIHRS